MLATLWSQIRQDHQSAILEDRSPFRRVMGRFFLFLGMFGPGILLATSPTKWITTETFYTSLHFPAGFVAILGLVMVVVALCSLFWNYRDFCYGIGAGFYGLVSLTYAIAFLQGHEIGALVVALPVLIWVYAESATIVSRAQRPSVARGGEENEYASSDDEKG